MFVKQISVFIDNKPGRLAAFTKILGDSGIDLIAVTVADTADFGILRGIVQDHDKAAKVASEAGYTVRLTDVLVASAPDVPGGLASILAVLADHQINLEYMYSFVRDSGQKALIVFRVDDIEKAAKALTENKITLLCRDDVIRL